MSAANGTDSFSIAAIAKYRKMAQYTPRPITVGAARQKPNPRKDPTLSMRASTRLESAFQELLDEQAADPSQSPPCQQPYSGNQELRSSLPDAAGCGLNDRGQARKIHGVSFSHDITSRGDATSLGQSAWSSGPLAGRRLPLDYGVEELRIGDAPVPVLGTEESVHGPDSCKRAPPAEHFDGGTLPDALPQVVTGQDRAYHVARADRERECDREQHRGQNCDERPLKKRGLHAKLLDSNNAHDRDHRTARREAQGMRVRNFGGGRSRAYRVANEASQKQTEHQDEQRRNHVRKESDQQVGRRCDRGEAQCFSRPAVQKSTARASTATC